MKRLISILLLAAILLSGAMIGCADTEEKKENSGTDPYAESHPEFDEYNRPWVESSLKGDYNFNEEEFTILITDEDDYKKDFYSEGLSGDIVNNATYERNLDVEDRLNVTVDFLFAANRQADIVRILRQTRESGDHAYTLGCVYGSEHMPLALDGYFYNLKELPNVDYSKPWWNQQYIEENTVLGQMYGVVNDINICGSMTITTCFVNVEGATNNNISLEELYAHVDNGTWTLETFSGYIKDLYQDDGDTKRGEEDFYGLLSKSDSRCLDGWTAAMNITTITKDSEGLPQLSFYSDRTEELYAKLHAIYHSYEGVLFEEDTLDYVTMFMKNKCVFLIEQLNLVNDFRNMDDPYSILPLPKADERQSNYYTDIGTMVNTMIMPSDLKNPELAGAVLEYMSELTYRDVRPTVFEKALKLKYFADQATGRMFDYVIDGIKCDFGITYTWTLSGDKYEMLSNYSTIIRNFIRKNQAVISTQYNRNLKTYNRGLEKLTKFFKENAK